MKIPRQKIARGLLMAASLALFACDGGDSAPVTCEDCEPTCTDQTQNGTETGVDCGGECAPCTTTDTCTNGVRDPGEDATDCGGDCAACVVAETCSNGTRDGDEADVDCGGSCLPCGLGATCASGPDCATGVCTDGKCADPTCDDGVKNGFESDIDCGPGCDGCVAGQACGFAEDCVSGACGDGVCVTCDDGAKNANETDVDCGGDVCDPCPDEAACVVNADCEGGQCDDGSCAGCDDGLQNGDEEDVDCGGRNCGPCLTQACDNDDACFYGLCIEGRCELPVATAIAAGDYHTCAVVQKGRVRCWGSDGKKQSGTIRNSHLRIVQTRVDNVVAQLEGMTHIYAGPTSTCASSPDALYCWGAFYYTTAENSSLAERTYAERLTYRVFAGTGTGGTTTNQILKNVTSVGLGAEHMCVTVDRKVLCWGKNDIGQLGTETTGTAFRPDGSRVTLTATGAQVAVGYGHACAVTGAGAVSCWGYNASKQTGRNSDSEVTAPYAHPNFVGADHAATHIYTRGNSSCALVGGAARCWGVRPFSVSPSLAGLNHIGFDFEGWADISRFALGWGFACAQTADGVSCVGSPRGFGGGPLESAMELNLETPTAVAGLDDVEVVDLVAGLLHACALMADGSVRCWGENGAGQLGDPALESLAVPTPWID